MPGRRPWPRSNLRPGRGRSRARQPQVPPGTQVGDSSAGAGAGSDPLYAPGKVYLAGPYKGAPLSFAVVTPGGLGPL